MRRRPWVLETIVFFGVLWLESIRLELRTAHRTLPVSAGVRSALYYHAGDFVNGYINAFIVDGLTEFIRRRRHRGAELVAPTRRQQAAIVSGLSALFIVVVELFPSAFNTPDVLDIPAGVAGALLYLIVRLFALRQA